MADANSMESESKSTTTHAEAMDPMATAVGGATAGVGEHEAAPSETMQAASPTANGMSELPADIEHILSLGAAQEEEESKAALSERVKQLKEEKGVDTTPADIEQPPKADGTAEASKGAAANDSSDDDDDEDDSSSSEDSSSDSSSSDASEAVAAALSPLKQRNRSRKPRQSAGSDLSDDDEDGPVSKSGPKTEHEIAQPDVAAPEIERIAEEYELAKLGSVQSVIDTVVVVKADAAGDYRVVDEGTILCWEDRQVAGAIFETFGAVQQPFYSLRFPSNRAPSKEVFAIGRPIFYAPKMASFVFTKELRAVKGSDASNVWDEEVGPNEMEWSDDEQEQEYKRSLKAARRSRSAAVREGSARPSVQPTHPRVGAIAGGPWAPSGPPSPFGGGGDSLPYDAAPSTSMIGRSPPSGSRGREMFEREFGSAGIGEEFEFSDSPDDESDDEDEGVIRADRQQSSDRGRGRGRGQARGRGRGRGDGRGRGGPPVHHQQPRPQQGGYGQHAAYTPHAPYHDPYRPSPAPMMPPPQAGPPQPYVFGGGEPYYTPFQPAQPQMPPQMNMMGMWGPGAFSTWLPTGPPQPAPPQQHPNGASGPYGYHSGSYGAYPYNQGGTPSNRGGYGR